MFNKLVIPTYYSDLTCRITSRYANYPLTCETMYLPRSRPMFLPIAAIEILTSKYYILSRVKGIYKNNQLNHLTVSDYFIYLFLLFLRRKLLEYLHNYIVFAF